MPALGESWGQASSTRVVLYWEGPARFAHLLKASHAPPGLGKRVAFAVTADGVRGAAAAAAAPPQQQQPGAHGWGARDAPPQQPRGFG